MTRRSQIRDFDFCKAVLLAGLIGVALLTSGLRQGAAQQASHDAFFGGQVIFIDWECDNAPVFAPMI
ncbi:hypothetical protein ACOXXX_00220 [Thalassococcus sp. BH17M4-6]|uniref:hypothetical protein n=1 Tax=Thalassococcus sp. BH17M4-6 TaxID=3413148 RepID=UPI003BC33E2B